jgi:hypothetical protein
MPGTTNVPPIEFTQTGLVLPPDSAILAGVQADMNAAFGGNLNQALSTPQGQLASSQSAILSAKNAEFARFVNQIDPATADGFMQDAIAKIYFLDRLPAVSTVVAVTCSGLTGVTIPQGSQVQDQSGNIYVSLAAGVIPIGGTVSIQFAALVPGPIACPPGAIVGPPYKLVLGWDSATNLTAGSIGQLVESRSDFEYRRRQSVALNARGSLPSIYANVFNVPNVTDVYVAENVEDTTENFGATSFPLVPHSIFVAVAGGAEADIAMAIWLRKDVGADYNGNTAVTVTDTSGYNIPYPTYTVKYHVAAATPILYAIQIAAVPGLPSGIEDLIKAAIVSAFNGGDGGPRARIGSTIFASRFYAPISNINPNISILSLMLGIVTATLPSVTMGINQQPTVSLSDITVTLV